MKQKNSFWYLKCSLLRENTLFAKTNSTELIEASFNLLLLQTVTVDTNAKNRNTSAVTQSQMEALSLATVSVVCRMCVPHEASIQHNRIIESHELSV